MAERKAVSKRTRFEVFKRDRFTCQYCGRKPPEAVLHLDHIQPVADGGTNDLDNLVTSCIDCNLGKSDKSLNDVRPVPGKERLAELAENREQLEAYQQFIAAERAQLEEDMIAVQSLFIDATRRELDSRQQTAVINFIRRIGYWEVREAAEIALSKSIPSSALWPYFCGICNNKARAAQNPALAERQLAANTMRRRFRQATGAEIGREIAERIMGRAIQEYGDADAAINHITERIAAGADHLSGDPDALLDYVGSFTTEAN